MTDIDAMLARLREMPADSRLACMDAAVLRRLDLHHAATRPLSGAIFGVAALAALTVGVVGAMLPNMPGQTASVTPFGTSPSLAPSTLLSSVE